MLLTAPSCLRSMFTLAPVTFTPCEVLMKDEATVLKCEDTAALVRLCARAHFFYLSAVHIVLCHIHCRGEYLCQWKELQGPRP